MARKSAGSLRQMCLSPIYVHTCARAGVCVYSRHMNTLSKIIMFFFFWSCHSSVLKQTEGMNLEQNVFSISSRTELSYNDEMEAWCQLEGYTAHIDVHVSDLAHIIMKNTILSILPFLKTFYFVDSYLLQIALLTVSNGYSTLGMAPSIQECHPEFLCHFVDCIKPVTISSLLQNTQLAGNILVDILFFFPFFEKRNSFTRGKLPSLLVT